MCPIDGPQTHGARFARRVNVAAAEVESAQFGASIANGLHLGMGGRVVLQGNAVDAFGHNFAVARYDGTKGAAPLFHVFDGQSYGAPHQFLFRHIVVTIYGFVLHKGNHWHAFVQYLVVCFV